MINPTSPTYELAVRDFQRARREAVMQQVLAHLRGRSDTLLCYDDVRQQLRAEGPGLERGLQEIPLDKIVGSVGRSDDFTRTFLPKKDSDQERWVGVKTAVASMKGLPPIEVYQIGDAYFVKDGNHRVSVARQLGTDTIAAYVTEVKARVPLTADDDPEEVICKSRYADFLEKTNLDQLRPDADLMMTLSGQYAPLLEQIESEYRLIRREQPELLEGEAWQQAVGAWYDNVYLPVVNIVRELGVMHRFSSRTEADIYVLLSERREELEAALGWHIDPQTAVPALIDQDRTRPLFNRVLDSVAPGLEEGPAAGGWRRNQLTLQRENHLFEYIMVLLEGTEDDAKIIDQVIYLSKKDNDQVLGLYVAPDAATVDEATLARVRNEFETRCAAAGLRYVFAVEYGRRDQAIIQRAAWVDLVVINLTNPPETHPLARIRPGWGTLIERCPRPILAIPNAVQSTNERMLLAYDGSQKADEALFVATYLAVRWERSLTVLTVRTPYTDTPALERARDYLTAHKMTWAEYILRDGPIDEAILETAADHDINLLIMGGFGRRPAMRLVLGSTVEHLLRSFTYPMLICR